MNSFFFFSIVLAIQQLSGGWRYVLSSLLVKGRSRLSLLGVLVCRVASFICALRHTWTSSFVPTARNASHRWSPRARASNSSMSLKCYHRKEHVIITPIFPISKHVPTIIPPCPKEGSPNSPCRYIYRPLLPSRRQRSHNRIDAIRLHLQKWHIIIGRQIKVTGSLNQLYGNE